MTRIVYVNGRYVPHARAAVHSEDRGYQFADGVYEVIAVRRGRLVDENGHLDRLNHSLSELRIGWPLSRRALKFILREVIRRNRLNGDGMAFIHVGGTVIKRELAPGEVLRVDTGCLAAMTGSVNYDIERAGNLKSMIFGGEGIFLATLRGPGTVYLQSLPFSRLADRVLRAAGPGIGNKKGEGSVLGGLGDMFGDR